MKLFRFSFGFLSTLFVFLVFSCSQKPDVLIGRGYTGLLFGTPYNIDVVGDSTDYQKQFDSIIHNFQFLFDVNNPKSIIARYNNFEQKDSAFAFTDSTHVFALVFDICRDLNSHTMQYYDPTTMPLKRAWMVAQISGEEEPNVDSLFEFVGFNATKVDLIEPIENHVVLRKSDARIELDFSDLAKAIALDHIADFLKNKEVEQYRISYGRDVITHGYEVDTLNIISMGVTEDENDLKLRMSNAAFTYSNVKDKQMLVDPTYGYPVDNEMAYVAVVAPTLAEAKGFSQAFIIMGLEKASEYYSEHEDSKIHSYMFYQKDNMLHSASTNGFDALIIGTSSENSEP